MTKIVTLDYPVTVDGEEIKTLTMRRPKARDQIGMERAGPSAAAREVQLFADLCGVKVDVIHEMDLTDYDKLQDAYTGFRKPASTPAPSGG